jgi:hypothetical protein
MRCMCCQQRLHEGQVGGVTLCTTMSRSRQKAMMLSTSSRVLVGASFQPASAEFQACWNEDLWTAGDKTSSAPSLAATDKA